MRHHSLGRPIRSMQLLLLWLFLLTTASKKTSLFALQPTWTSHTGNHPHRKRQSLKPKHNHLPFRFLPSRTAVALTLETSNMDGDRDANHSLESVLRFTRTNPNAVVLSLWPSAIIGPETTTAAQRQVDVARSYLQRSGAKLLYESKLEIPESVSTLLVMAMYWGEDWLRTNCWYGEQPLEELGIPGLERPKGAWPGAKWKKELCFRQESSVTKTMYVLVADLGDGGSSSRRLWYDKYSVRARMARDTGHAGNSCMHLTDDQSGILLARSSSNGGSSSGGKGMDCNASYAFACARCLLNPEALKFLVHLATMRFVDDESLQSEEFQTVFGEFCEWLGDTDFEDVVVVDGKEETVERWNRPPIW